MPLSVMTEAEIEDARQRRECVGCFVQTYRQSIGHDPNDAEIARHLECESKHNIASWVNPNDNHRDDVLSHKGIGLI